MAFEKITDTSLANKGVTGLPDVPGLSTAEMQAKFDELSRDVIIPKLNEIVDGLNGYEVGLSSKIENPETKEKDVIQNVVNAIYQIVKENSDKRHGHENKETLDKVTAELYNSITALVSMFNGISAVDKTVTADDTKIPTSGAIVNYVTELGAGDMQKAVYDKDNTGIVDDAEKLGGVAPEEYLQKASLPDATVAFDVAETRSNISTGEKVSTVFGKIKKFFSDLTAPAFAQMITTKEDLLATKVTGYVPDAKAVADTYTELNGNLVASDNTHFRFGVNKNGEYGYIVTDSEGADSVVPFKTDNLTLVAKNYSYQGAGTSCSYTCTKNCKIGVFGTAFSAGTNGSYGGSHVYVNGAEQSISRIAVESDATRGVFFTVINAKKGDVILVKAGISSGNNYLHSICIFATE